MTTRLAARLAAAVAALMLFGCVGPWIEVDGQRYHALNDEETRDLIYRARLVLYHNTKVVTRAEYRRAAGAVPDLTVNYNGDWHGTAELTWKLPERDITVVYNGDLRSDKPKFGDKGAECFLKVTPHNPEVLDFTQRPSPGR